MENQATYYKRKNGYQTVSDASLSEYVFGKVQPQAVELEEAVLGALMLDKEAFLLVSEMLRPESFYHERNQVVYAAIVSLFEKSAPVDILTVTEELRRTGNLEKVLGGVHIVELAQKVASAANIEYHARIVQQKAIERGMIQVCTNSIRDAYNGSSDVFENLDRHERDILSLRSGKENGVHRVPELTNDVLRQIEAAVTALESGKTVGIPSGIRDLDRETGGFRNTDLTVIGARPGMGKSAFVNTIALTAAKAGSSVGIFSLEMSAAQFIARMVSAESGVNGRHMNTGKVQASDFDAIIPAIEKINALPIHIDDTPALSILSLRAKARRMKSRHGIKILMIDYLQLMSPTDRSGNREQQVAEISRGLKALAKELEIPIIALSQLSRAVETRGGSKRPQLSDLRESGAVEQDSDNVLFLYRPEYYGIMEDENGQSLAGVAEIIIAKNRHGRAGSDFCAVTRYIAELTIFRDDDTPRPGTTSTQFPNTQPTYIPQPVPRMNEADIPF